MQIIGSNSVRNQLLVRFGIFRIGQLRIRIATGTINEDGLISLEDEFLDSGSDIFALHLFYCLFHDEFCVF